MAESLLVDAQWLQEHLHDHDLLIVDTRGASDYQDGHLPGAINLPSAELFDPDGLGSAMRATAELEKRLGSAGIDSEQYLVLYDSSGLVPSAKVFWVLEHLGRSRVALLNGGFPRWVSLSFPTEQGSVPPAPATFHAAPPAETERDGGGAGGPGDGVQPEEAHSVTRDNVADKDDVLAGISREDTVIIDSRTPEEYYGRTGEHVRNGHIPGARNVDWQQHIADLFDPTLMPIPELAELYKDIGVNRDSRIITYCRTASRSSHTYFVLRLLGFEHIRNYAGSWMEWCADESLPIE